MHSSQAFYRKSAFKLDSGGDSIETLFREAHGNSLRLKRLILRKRLVSCLDKSYSVQVPGNSQGQKIGNHKRDSKKQVLLQRLTSHLSGEVRLVVSR